MTIGNNYKFVEFNFRPFIKNIKLSKNTKNCQKINDTKVFYLGIVSAENELYLVKSTIPIKENSKTLNSIDTVLATVY